MDLAPLSVKGWIIAKGGALVGTGATGRGRRGQWLEATVEGCSQGEAANHHHQHSDEFSAALPSSPPQRHRIISNQRQRTPTLHHLPPPSHNSSAEVSSYFQEPKKKESEIRYHQICFMAMAMVSWGIICKLYMSRGVNEPSRARIPPSSARARLSCCRLELELGSFKVWYPSSSSAREKCKKLELGSARLARLGSIRLASLIELTNIGSGSARLINELLNGTRARLGLDSGRLHRQNKSSARTNIINSTIKCEIIVESHHNQHHLLKCGRKNSLGVQTSYAEHEPNQARLVLVYF
ncbi:hypothetical protein LXL04_000684 [Taraxacum kok-saghyz]